MADADDQLAWSKSSYSLSGDCLEWAIVPGTVWVRDSKDRSGPRLALTWSEWGAFLAGARAGEADLPSADD